MERIEDFQVLNQIGRGGFASVYRAVCRAGGKEYAIKMVDKNQMNASGMSGRVRQEVTIHSRLKHPAILELIAYFEDADYVYLVLELCEKGELGRFLKQNNMVFSELEAKGIFQQVVSGLIYLHSHGIMHRDLTLANLMLTHDMKVKIGDFGLATQVNNAQDRHVTMCGTPNYISPEVATRSSHGLEADIWGLGCLLYTLLVGTPPFDTSGVRSTLTKVVMADYQLPSHLSHEAADLIASMLRKNPTERVKLRDIPNHPWFRIHQDSGMFTMTTGFSSNSQMSSSSSRPGPRPLQAFPMRPVPEHSVENEKGSARQIRSEPVLSNPRSGHQSEPIRFDLGQPIRSTRDHLPCSPPVRMRSDPQDLPAPLLGLKAKMSSLPTLPQPLSSLPQSYRDSGRQETNYHSSLSLHRQFSDPQSSLEERTHYSEPRDNGSGPARYKTQTSLQEYASVNRSVIHNHPSDSRPHSSAETNHLSHQERGFQTGQIQSSQGQNINNGYGQRDEQNNFGQNGFGQNVPMADNPARGGRVPSKRIEDIVEPLSSLRLRPTRQKTKNAVANILSNGEVCLEFLKTKKSEERVMDVLRISGDGTRIVVYHPGGKGEGGVPVTNKPPAIPPGGADAIYSYSSLPEKLWKKYLYAARFISLVKAKTPKITLYSTKAKSYLMENTPPDFESYFYSGVKITCSAQQIKLIDTSGTIHNFRYPPVFSDTGSCTLYLQHFVSCIQHCQSIVNLLTDNIGVSETPIFPLIVGRKPVQDLKLAESADSSIEKENHAPAVNNLNSFKGTIMSTVGNPSKFSPNPQNFYVANPPTSSRDLGFPAQNSNLHSRGGSVREDGKMSMRSDLSRTLQIQGVGLARLLPDGRLRINYEDASSLVVGTNSAVEYLDPGRGGTGGWTRYAQADLPPAVKGKLSLVPKILEKLLNTEPQGAGR